MKSSKKCLIEIFEDIAILLLAGCRDRHDSFDETAAFLALGPEADLTPQDSLPDSPFGSVVGWLNTLVIDERPHVVFFRDETFADSGYWTLSTHLSIDEKVGYLDPQFFHPMLECGSFESPVSDPMPPMEHQVGFVHQLFADFPGFALHFRESDKCSSQVRPAKLAQPFVDAVGCPPVRTQDSAEVPNQFLGGISTTADVNHEHRHGGCDGHPEPGFLVAFSPSGFVGIQHPGILRVLMCFFDRFPENPADILLARRNRTKADLDPEEISHDVLDEPLALVVNARQKRHHNLCFRAKVAGWDSLRQFGLSHVAAVLACTLEHLPLENDRLDLREFPNLMTPWIGSVDLQVKTPALLANPWVDDLEMVHILLVHQLAMVSFVTRLSAALAF